MRAGQREVAAVMVEIRILPVGRVMAGRAICAKLTVMLVILSVAGITVHRCCLVLSIHMTRLTANFGVFSFQFERREVMVKRCGSPAICRVTLAAIQSEAALMRLIVMVTGVAIL